MTASPAACVSETSGKANWCATGEAGVGGSCDESEGERDRMNADCEDEEGDDGGNEEYSCPKDDEDVE